MEIAKTVANIFGVEVSDLRKKINAPLELVPNVVRIKETLKWKPEISLEEGIKNTINYYKNAKQ